MDICNLEVRLKSLNFIDHYFGGLLRKVKRGSKQKNNLEHFCPITSDSRY